jgi:hypothetical protein
LKWQFQPSHRTRPWSDTIRRERLIIKDDENDSRSLKAAADEIMLEAYPSARVEAAGETDLPLNTFPATCPWTLDQIRNPDFLPA